MHWAPNKQKWCTLLFWVTGCTLLHPTAILAEDKKLGDSVAQSSSILPAPTPPPDGFDSAPIPNASTEAPPVPESDLNPTQSTTSSPDGNAHLSGKSKEDDTEDEKLPEILAETFHVKIIRKSKSSRIYLLEDLDNRQPKPGHLLLLREQNQPVMAFRILKDYLEEKKIAAKRIRRYPNYPTLADGQSFLAIEKISDINPPWSNEDREDLKELESKENLRNILKVKVYDPELDATVTPHNNSDNHEPDLSEEPDADADHQQNITVEQMELMDLNRSWLTAGFGYVRNNGPPGSGGSYLFTSGNLRYGYTIGKLVFLDKARIQDSLTVDGGIYVYKELNFETQGDSYTVLSFSAALRYNILFSKTFGIFLQLGILQNNVISATLSESDGLAALNSIVPIAGTGLLFEMGPSWFIRTDLGYDSIGVNLVLRF